MDAYGYFCRPENIRLPDGNLIDFKGRDADSVVRELTDTARKYVNDEYADFLQMFVTAALSDCEYIESENEDLRATLDEIESVLQQYESKVFDRKTRLYRKDLDAMLKAVHSLINEVI